MARISNKHNAKLIHISTDCVFSGSKGLYDENSDKDANDFYGKTKSLGELNDMNNLTLRTSTIGHEAFTSFGLLNWFLDQKMRRLYKSYILRSNYSRACKNNKKSNIIKF